MEEKIDLRVKRTKEYLAKTLLRLLEKQSFSKISVNDICLEASVSRSAFYYHFQDKYDLVLFALDSLKQTFPSDQASLSLEDRLRLVLDNVKQNIRVFKNLLLADLDVELLNLFRQSFRANFQAQGLDIKDCSIPGIPEITMVFYVSGISSSIIHWVQNNTPYSVEEMTQSLLAIHPPVL